MSYKGKLRKIWGPVLCNLIWAKTFYHQTGLTEKRKCKENHSHNVQTTSSKETTLMTSSKILLIYSLFDWCIMPPIKHFYLTYYKVFKYSWILHLYNHSHHHGGRKPTTILRLVKELQNCFDNLCLNTPSWPCLSCAHQCWQEMKADSHCWMTASSMSSFCLLVACSRVCTSLAALASRLYFSFSMYNSLWSWSFWNGNSSWIIILF